MTLTTLGAAPPDPDLGSRPKVTVLVDRCAGCQECVVRCPTEALSMDVATWTAVADDAKCIGCRQCVRTCPFSAIYIDGPVVVAERVGRPAHHLERLEGNLEETRLGFSSWADVVAEASRCLSCPDPTCVRGCPVHNDIPGFIAAVREGDLDEAHRVLRRTSFLPDVCSRVCDQAVQCEGACTWSLAGGAPVAIGAIERFITDNAPVPGVQIVSEQGRGLEVAIVGAGPAGIAAAWELAQAGTSVTVFEKDEQPGGLIRWGIPDFTLPRSVSSRAWVALEEAGVNLRCGTEVDPGELAKLSASYDAVVLAHGAGVPMRLPVKGGDLEGVWDATRFLVEARAAVAEHRPLAGLTFSGRGAGGPGGPGVGGAQGPGGPDVGGAGVDSQQDGHAPTVLVLGAGNTAMDVARLARRLGAHAICVDWMDRRFAPVRPDELDEAALEGVDIRFSTTLGRLDGEGGRVATAVLDTTRQEAANRLPEVVGHETASVAVDLVVMAMGYRLDPGYASVLPGVPVARRASGVADRGWQASGLIAGGAPAFARHQPIGQLALGRENARVRASLGVGDRLWVAGDALVGPSTVVEAMAQGRKAAQAILDEQPKRDGRQASARPLRVLVGYESRSGHTERAARTAAASFEASSAEVKVVPLSSIGVAELARADLVVVGTWVEGLVVAAVQSAKATRKWLAGLPPLGGKHFAIFCTYGVAPKGALTSLQSELESRGGVVIAAAAFGPRPSAASSPEKLALSALEKLGAKHSTLGSNVAAV
ncbi:MAG: FAD-dependent oxidoreductase [Acidimicrobiales bacterium]